MGPAHERRPAARRGAGDRAGRRRADRGSQIARAGGGARSRPRRAGDGRRVAAALGQLGDGRVRDPGRRRGGRDRGAPVRLAVVGEVPRGRRARTRASSPGPRSASRPARPCRRAPTRSSRSSGRRRSTRRAARAAGPRRAGPVPAAMPRPAGVRRGGADPPAGQRPRGRRLSSRPARSMTPGGGRARRGAGLDRRLVRRRPRVAVLATGDEVRAPGAGARRRRDPGRERSGAACPGRRRRGDPARPRDRCRTARGRRGAAPARPRGGRRVVVSGGVSVGPYDVVRLAFESVGHDRTCGGSPSSRASRSRSDGRRRRARRPGRSCSACPATRSRAFVTFELFVRPAIRRLAGHGVACSGPSIARSSTSR